MNILFTNQDIKTIDGFELHSGQVQVIGKDKDYQHINYVVGETNDGIPVQGMVKDGEFTLFQSSKENVNELKNGVQKVDMVNMLTIPYDCF